MFNDIGPLELVALVVLAVLVFGPDKLPKVIQDVIADHPQDPRVLRQRQGGHPLRAGPGVQGLRVRGPQPQDVRPQAAAGHDDDLGLKEIRNSFDLKKEMAEVTDAVHGEGTSGPAARRGLHPRLRVGLPPATSASRATGPPSLLKPRRTRRTRRGSARLRRRRHLSDRRWPVPRRADRGGYRSDLSGRSRRPSRAGRSGPTRTRRRPGRWRRRVGQGRRRGRTGAAEELPSARRTVDGYLLAHLPLVRPGRGLHRAALADAGRARRPTAPSSTARSGTATSRPSRTRRGRRGPRETFAVVVTVAAQPRAAQRRRHGRAGGHVGVLGGLAGRVRGCCPAPGPAQMDHALRDDWLDQQTRRPGTWPTTSTGPTGRALPARWTACRRRSTTASRSSAGCWPGRRGDGRAPGRVRAGHERVRARLRR